MGLTPRESFLRVVTIFLCYAPDKDWKLEEEMQGWGVGEDRLATLVETWDVNEMMSEVIDRALSQGSIPE